MAKNNFAADCELSQERWLGATRGERACGSASGCLWAGWRVGASGGGLLRANLVVPLRQGRAGEPHQVIAHLGVGGEGLGLLARIIHEGELTTPLMRG